MDKFVLKDRHGIIAKIEIKLLMDDVSIYTKLNYDHIYYSGLQSTFKKAYKRSMENKITIKEFLQLATNKKHQKIAKQLSILFQDALTWIHRYLNANNIPTNNTKSHVITFQDFLYQQYCQLRNNMILYHKVIFHINVKMRFNGKSLVDKDTHSQTFYLNTFIDIVLQLFKHKPTEYDPLKYNKAFAKNMIDYAHKQNIWFKTKDNNNKDIIILMDLQQANEFIEMHNKLKNYNDYLRAYRHKRYSMDNMQTFMKNESEIKILGRWLDKNWTFNKQTDTTIRDMQLVRLKCHKLLDENHGKMGMGVMKHFINSTSLVLLQYAGNTFLNMTKTNGIRTEYNKTINVMNNKIKTLTLLERMNWNGFNSFEATLKQINAKSFSKLLRNHNANPLQQKRDKFLNEIRKWKQKLQINSYDFDEIKRHLPKVRDRSIFWQWYSDALELRTTDSRMCLEGNHIERNAVHFIPPELPQCIHFQPFANQWNNKLMDHDKIVIALDGSLFPYGKHTKDKIFGAGGFAIRIYFKYEVIGVIRLPVSTRTHIGAMEMLAFHEAFVWINDQNNWIKYIQHAKGILLVSDSRTCINTISQKCWPNDDILIKIHKQICIQLESIKTLPFGQHFIDTYWVHSHAKEQTINDEVDEDAKAIALVALTMHDNEFNPKLWLNCNEYIAYNTIKSEIKHLANYYDEESWEHFKNSHQNSYLSQYFKYKVQWNPRKYAKVIPFLNELYQDLRVMLLSNQLPLNEYMKTKAGNMSDEYEYCIEHEECMQRGTLETLEHMLLICPGHHYQKQRQFMLQNMQSIYNENNEALKDKKYAIKFDPNSSNIDYLYNHLIYKPYNMKAPFCAKAVKLVCDYVRATRPDIITRYKNGKCIKVNDNRINHVITYNNTHENMDTDDSKEN